MNPIIGLILLPIIFFFIGFLFKKVRPYYRPVEFVFSVMILAILGLLLAFGSALFSDFTFFIQVGLIHVTIYISFAFIGLLTNKLVEMFKKKFVMLNGFVHVISMLAIISTMLLLSFSIQYALALSLYK